MQSKVIAHIISDWHRKVTFNFSEIANNQAYAVRDSKSNCQICFSLFSGIKHMILKIFSQYGLIQCT